MIDSPRIDDLRRRIAKDPASILFAQLAEEYRRAGDPREAVRLCRAGLPRYPGYLSARVTLARALMDLDCLEEAAAELDQVLAAAPDNLAANRSRLDLQQRRATRPITADAGATPSEPAAPGPSSAPGAVAVVDEPAAVSREPRRETLPSPLEPRRHDDGAASPADVVTLAALPDGTGVTASGSLPSAPTLSESDRAVLARLEEWLQMIETERAARSGRATSV